MPKRIFTVTFDVADDEFENFMTRLAGGAVLSNEIPRNTTVNTGGDDDDGPVNTNAPAVNEQGVPWDARYHGVKKVINADKSWKRIKGLSDALKAEADAFEAAAKAAFVAASAAPVTLPVAETPVTLPVAEVVAAPAPVVGLPVAPVAAAMPGLPLPVAPVAPPPVSMDEVIALFGATAVTHPSVATNYLQLYAECGITDPNTLTTDETLRRKLFDKLTEISKTPAQVAA